MEQIAMYLRLSKEDEFIRDESNSITNQRAFIREFINKDKALRKMNVLEFVDDGFTGKNMDRPDMQRMLDLIKRKQISCVIVKDFSRFSRDHIEQGKYIEQIFPFMGVRFIAINDNYDSADYVGGIGEIDIAFKGILYDFFSEEQSVKVSTTLDAKRSSGKYIAAFAPYGYVKSPEDKHKLVVDEVASLIVKRIFREFLSGKSMYKIAEGLNLEGIDSPGVYIAMQENNENQLAKYREKKPLWSNVAVGRILANEQYIGTMVYNRFKSENVGDKHAKALPEEEWKRVENCHVAIISKEDFEKAAAKRSCNTCASAERKHETHCLTDRETYLEQKKTYEQLLERMQDNIKKQKAAVSKMAAVDLPEVAGFEMLEGQMKLQKLNKEIVDTFVAEIVVHAKDRVEIKWKFRDEFREAEKGEICSK